MTIQFGVHCSSITEETMEETPQDSQKPAFPETSVGQIYGSMIHRLSNNNISSPGTPLHVIHLSG